MVYGRYLEANLFILQEQLRNGSYTHDPYQPFVICDPKRREIHKASVKDRIVHQAIVQCIEPFFEGRFIFDSYSCRIGKGLHAGVSRLRTFLRSATHNNTRTVYALKLDIRRFFASVDHTLLISLLARRIPDVAVMSLLEKIIASFSSTSGKGIPLGNLTSQLFANVYLHEFDWFVKHELREQWYVRYCDDTVILTHSRVRAIGLIERIEVFLRERLLLQLHPDKIHIRTWPQGIDFLGYVLLPNAIVLRTKTKRRMLQRADAVTLSSYLGMCKHARAHGVEQVLKNKIYGSEGLY